MTGKSGSYYYHMLWISFYPRDSTQETVVTLGRCTIFAQNTAPESNTSVIDGVATVIVLLVLSSSSLSGFALM